MILVLLMQTYRDQNFIEKWALLIWACKHLVLLTWSTPYLKQQKCHYSLILARKPSLARDVIR